MELVKINDVCKISNGFAFKSDKYTTEAGARVIRITNVQKGKILDNDPKIYPFSELSKLDNYKIFENDILMSLTGNVGRVGKFPKELLPAYINQRICRIMPKSDNLDANYLFHFLNSDKFENDAIKNSAGAAQLNLSTNWLSTYEIPVPPLEIQKHIAQILDDADALRDKTRQLIKEYDVLAQSIFLEMFGDPVRNEKEWEKERVIDYSNCVVPGRDKPKSFTGNIPWITTDDLIHLGNTRVSKKKIGLNEEEILNVKAKKIPAGSVLITCVGNLGVISINEYEVIINQQLHSFQCFDSLNNIFLMYSLNFQKEYMYKMASTTTVPYMNKTICNSIPIIIPPIDLQNQFAEKIALIEQQKELAKQELKESEDLFNCLLQKAFKGELK